VIKAVLPDNTPPSGPDSPGDNPVITFEYDHNGNCVKETKANGQEIQYTYNGRNWLLSQTTELNGKRYTTGFEYDGVGNKRYVTDNKGNKTEYQYDALNRMVRTYLPEGNTVETFFDANSNQTATRDGRHNGSDFVYDKLNRMVQATDAEGNVTEFWYDREGKLTKQQSPTGQITKIYLNEIGMAKRVLDSLGRSLYYDYDAAGNVIYKRDPRNTEAVFEYDDLYRVLGQTLQNGSRYQSLSYEYDQVGNVKRASNGRVELIYNDADGSYESDPFNRIKKVKQVMPDGASYTTQYQYDISGQMTGIRYPNSADWLTYQYDQMGRLVGIPGFAGTKSNPGFAYDDNSALESIKTDNGVITSYRRDKNGRITNIDAVKSGSGILSLKYTHDAANNIITRNDNSYVYDKVNRLQQATIRGYFEDNFTKTDMLIGKVDQDYHGQKEQEEDVMAQTQIKLDYSARSLIFNLKFDAENICRVELVPEITSHRLPSDQLDIYYRNGVGFTKLEKSEWAGTKDDKGRIIIRFTPVLNTSEIKIHCNYDDLDYLQMPLDKSQFTNSPEKLVTVYQKFVARTETYGYDGMGNRTSEKILLRKEYGYTYSYGPKSNRLMSKVKDDGSEKIEYDYDENGNLTSKVVTKGSTVDTWEYAYDLLNQLEQVKKNRVTVSSYIYDPNGFRVEKIGSKGRIDYVPLLNGEVGYRKEFSSGKEYSFIYVGGQHLARVNGVIGGDGKKFFYHNDHLGTALAIVDEDGKKIVERDFAPFGERLQLKENDATGSDEDDSAFTGKDWDADIELYYYNARWYDPEIGRFTSEDSVTDDPNLYGYCRQNPVNMVDPTGYTAEPGGFKITFADPSKNPLGFVNATMNALATLSGDSNLSNVMSVFNLFIAAKPYIDKIILQARINYYIRLNKPLPVGLSNNQDKEGKGLWQTIKDNFKSIIAKVRTLKYESEFPIVAVGEATGRELAYEYQALLQKYPGCGISFKDYLYLRGYDVYGRTTISAQDVELLADTTLALFGVDNFKDIPEAVAGKTAISGEELSTIQRCLMLLPVVSGAVVKQGGKLVKNVDDIGETHHIATDKSINSGFTEQFKQLFSKAGLTLNNDINKIKVIGHKGRHSAKYHQWVLDRLTNATEGLRGSDYKDALIEELFAIGQDVVKNPQLLKGVGLK
jgi:RHS repeat-associated protein